MPTINTLSPAPLRDNTAVTSTINGSYLVTLAADPYFNDSSKMSRVDIYYYDSSGRDFKIITHMGPALVGTVAWSTFAPDGTWAKNRVRLLDYDGAELILGRDTIGTGEDVFLP